MIVRGAFAVGLAFGLGSLGSAQIKATPAGHLFRAKYVKGQVLRYRSINRVTGVTTPSEGNKPISITVPILMKVDNVVKEIATVRMAVGPVMMGKNELFGTKTAIVKLNTRNESTGASAGSSVAQLPNKPIKVNQTWTAQIPISGGLAGVKQAQGRFRFLGVKSVDGKGVAVISYTVSGSATGSGTMALLTSDGTLYSNQMKLSIALGGPAPATLSSSIKRL